MTDNLNKGHKAFGRDFGDGALLRHATLRAVNAWNALDYTGTEADIAHAEREWTSSREALHEHLQRLGFTPQLIQQMGAVL